MNLLEFYFIFAIGTPTEFMDREAKAYAKLRAEFRDLPIDYQLKLERHEALDRKEMHGYKVTLYK